jgi:hypothetical protein
VAQTEGDLYAALTDETHSFALELVNPGDVEAAVKAMNAAARGMARVRHPEEPTEQFANMISRVYETEDSAWFDVDVKDHYAFPVQCKLLVRAAIRATDKPELADAILKWTDRRPPPPPFRGRDLPRETPVHLPPGFELPDGAKVARTRLSGYEAKWRWASWDVLAKGNVVSAAQAYRDVLRANGWHVGDWDDSKAEALRDMGLEGGSWGVTGEDATGHVSAMGVVDWTTYGKGKRPSDSEDPELVELFKRGEAWHVYIEFTPTASGWKPYVDEEVPWPTPLSEREPEPPRIESFDPERQELRQLAYRLANDGDEETDRERRARLLDWFVREETPARLRPVGRAHELADLRSLATTFELKPVLEALTSTVVAIQDRLSEFPRGDSPRHRGEDEFEMHDNLSDAVVHGVGEFVRAAGTRVHELLRRRDELAQRGVALSDAAWSAIWKEATRDAWMRAWGTALADASSVARPINAPVFPDWSDIWPSGLGQAVAAAAAARYERDEPAWEAHVRPALRANETWTTLRQASATERHAKWMNAMEAAMAVRFDEVVDARFYGNVVRCGIASIARMCQRLADYVLVLETRQAAYERGESDEEADAAAKAVIADVQAATRLRVRAILEELLGPS